MIPVLRPTADAATKQALLDVIDSGWWGQGPKVAELEVAFATLVGTQYAIATNSCTAALDLVLQAYAPKGRLVTTAMTFVADAIVGEWNGLAVEFGDIDPDSLCLAAVDYGNPAVIIAVHSHGRLADIAELRRRNPDSLIIEDCAHACYTPTAGSLGDIAVWSFQAVKTVPAGDGGMITTNDGALTQKLRNLSWLGVEKSTFSRVGSKKYSWDYDITHGGAKSYMNDINAVLALGNLKRLDTLLAKRQMIQKAYNMAFDGLPTVTIPMWSETCQYYTLKVAKRDAISQILADKGIATSVHFKPLSEMTYWKKAVVRPLPITTKVWPQLLSLPCHDALKAEDIVHIIASFKEAVRNV